MTIEFDQIPADIRIPLAYIEFNNTLAQSLVDDTYTLLVLGQKLSAGTAAANTPIEIAGTPDAITQFGAGSMLAAMFAALKAANPYTKTVAIALVDAPTATPRTATFTVTGTASAAGALALYIAGVPVFVPVADGDSATTIAAAVTTAVNANSMLLMSGANTGAVVTLTAKNAGLAANQVTPTFNDNGESLPAGITLTAQSATNGAVNPDISTAIAAMGDDWYQAIVMPYRDAQNIATLTTELDSRFGPLRQIDGIAYGCIQLGLSAIESFGAGNNDPSLVYLGCYDPPQPEFIWAAVLAGVAAASLADDPARPLQTLPLTGLLPPSATNRFTWEERNQLLYSGIATNSYDASGTPIIGQLITSYQKNVQGLTDVSYLYVNTLATLSYIRYQTRAAITTKYPRCKLAADGTPFGPGQAIVTPSIIRAELIALATDFAAAGLIEDLDQFKAGLLVEIDATNPNRLNALIDPNLVNQFRIFAAQIQFVL